MSDKKTGMLLSILFLFVIEAFVPPLFYGFNVLISKWIVFQVFLFLILIIILIGYWIRSDELRSRNNTNSSQKMESGISDSDSKFISPSKLIGAVAHEVRSPLNKLQLKLHKSPDEVDWDALNETYNEVTAIFDRVESVFRDQDPNKIWIPVPKFCNIVINEIQSPGLINWQIGLDWILIDPFKIRLALKNLIKNSQEAYDDKLGAIDVHFFSYGPEWCIKVSDFAGGIDPELARTISTQDAKTKTKGMGLGLMIAQQIVKNHSGRMVIESEDTVGTEITMTFPIQNNC